ncbi:MAG: hypothetical protein Q9224_001361 [Gallowayella concinna]
MDYKADQEAVPYILDEFSQMWETPFSPTNRSFPCTQERPPDLSRQDAEQRMYMANHNLNTELTLVGRSLLVVTVSLLNETNNVTGFGSLGLMADQCKERWLRSPNFLLVDYYNVGAGSVFEVAAQHNNVTFDRSCCGMVPSSATTTGYGNVVLAKNTQVLVVSTCGLLLIQIDPSNWLSRVPCPRWKQWKTPSNLNEMVTNPLSTLGFT